jgi:2-polyprenyl-3-methyl-5-hydroxy-6-metoxy-1,4-benzoquinol methylase
MLSSSVLTQIKSIFNKVEKNEEFEVMFNNYKSDNQLSIVKWMDVIKYLRWRSDDEKLKIIEEKSLDISYGYEPQKNYRISVVGFDNINKILNLVHTRKNNIIFSILVSQFAKDENFKFINKIKDPKNIVDIDQYDIRVRKSLEEPINEKKLKELSNVPIGDSNKIFYRYKQRFSLILLDGKDEKAQIDLTIIKSSKNPNDLQIVPKSYELEIDFMATKPTDKHFNMLIKEIEKIKQVMEGTNKLISKDDMKVVIENYKKLTFGISSEPSSNLYSMQPISAEVTHVVDKIPNKYSVTDKADGEKYQLFVFEENIYLISTNLNVKKINKTIKGYNNTIIEGELIHLISKNIYLFMGFDCLIFNGKDVRNEVLLVNRLKFVNDILGALQNNKNYQAKPYEGKFDMDKQEKHYSVEIEKFYQFLNKLISEASDGDYLFHNKLFIFPTGGSSSEVFLYAYLIHHGCTNSNNVNCPYYLDGIIFTGIEQKYSRERREHKYPIYKYKPPENNSIDIYVTFQRNPETGKYLEIFDNSLPIKMTDTNGSDQVFRVANFFVGDTVGNKEVPVPFMKEENNHEAFFPLVKGEVRDVEGNFIQDNTVIEVIYVNNQNVPHQYRWSILRTRWDKTESVIRDQKKYGNFKDVAIKTWKSMKEAVTIEEIKKLSNPDTYNQQLKILQSRIDTLSITSDRAQDKYYQEITNLLSLMKGFHNWVKSILIYTYCQGIKENKDGKFHKANILDFGCGRGGDIQKFYHARVGEYVGVDIDYDGLFASTDSAVSRYNFLKSKFPDYGKMTYIQADASTLLKSDLQSKRLNNMTQDNKNNIDKFFDGKKKYDVITSMFAIHYLFSSQESVENLVTNINTYLKVGGFIVMTLFDSEQVLKLLNNTDVYTSYYTDDNGQKTKLFELTKKFTGNLKDEPGQTIDVFMKWINQNALPENLVSSKLMMKTMEKAGCRLIETDLFANIFNINKYWFSDVVPHEENPKNKKFYEDVGKFFDNNLKGADKESKSYSFLNRYYVFQKME